jgi:hypothetical protein
MKPNLAHRVPGLALFLELLAGPLAAQGRLALGVAAGPSPYDLSGTGTGITAAALLAWRPSRGLVVEPALGVFSYTSQFDERTILLLPEIGVQGELVKGSFRPFLGAGGGASLGLSGWEKTGLTLHGVGGARLDLSRDWTLLGEMRVRWLPPGSNNTVDFLFGVSRALEQQPPMDPGGASVAPRLVPASRFEIAGHLGIHVDHTDQADRAVSDGSNAIYSAPGEASAFAARLGYWIRPSRGLQLDVSHSSNASWEGSTGILVPDFANRTTYVSVRGVIRTSPTRPGQLFAAVGPALMLYGGTGDNLRTSDADLGGVVEVGGRWHVSNQLAIQLALSNYLYNTSYKDQGSVFRHDPLILPGLLYSWR